jgi:hypothetical protein
LFLTLTLVLGTALAQTSNDPTPGPPKPAAKSSHKPKKSKPKKAAKKPKKSVKRTQGKTQGTAKKEKVDGEPQVETEITQKAVTIDLQGK